MLPHTFCIWNDFLGAQSDPLCKKSNVPMNTIIILFLSRDSRLRDGFSASFFMSLTSQGSCKRARCRLGRAVTREPADTSKPAVTEAPSLMQASPYTHKFRTPGSRLSLKQHLIPGPFELAAFNIQKIRTLTLAYTSVFEDVPLHE